jgi:ABC-type transport system involved in cytochrome c biogenesis permease subunit
VRLPWRGVRGLLCLAVALDLGALALGANLLLTSPPAAPPLAAGKLAVPYADSAALWAPLHRWVVQDDGRHKPFDTFCRETVRTVTGRERFEGNDPVAVVVSWLLLHESRRDRAEAAARRTGCDWENHPFLLCDFRELRELLYADKRGEGVALTEEERHGRHVEPAVLRWSLRRSDKPGERPGRAAEILARVAARTDGDAKTPLSPLEDRLLQLKKRLDLYDGIRAGGVFDDVLYDRIAEGEYFQGQAHPADFGVVALDRNDRTWFSLASVREHYQRPGYWQVTQKIRRTENPSAYEGKPAQPYPEAEIRDVVVGYANLREAYRSGKEKDFAASASAFLGTVARVSGAFGDYPGTDAVDRELWFNEANPFRKAWVFSLLAALVLAGSVALGGYRPGLGRVLYLGGLLAYAGGLVWAVVGFWCRVSISGRPPVSNMYESVIWVGFMTAAFGLVLELVYRRGVIALMGSLVSALCLVLADQLPLTFNPAIQPLQAVLRSNYWLIIHVLTIVSSYAAFALAWGLGNLNLGLILFAPRRADLIRTVSRFCYRAIQIGVALLAAGTFLGGFWAAESWGRFWGWDPKEVWALIALLCYVIPLHARYVGWVKDFGLAVCSVTCFASVVMAWYGVNFVLGAGLHSYGFGGGRDAWVYFAGVVNLAVVAHAAVRYRSARRAALGGSA